MRRHWDLEDLVGSWTLSQADWELVSNKSGATRLGFCLLLKFFQLEGRFPADAGEIPAAAVTFVAGQVGVGADQIVGYDWAGRSIEDHRRQIRHALGFRVFTRGDEDKMVAWLAAQGCPEEEDPQQLAQVVRQRCRAERLEPAGRVERIVAGAAALAQHQFCTDVVGQLSAATVAGLAELVAAPEDTAAAATGLFAQLKADPGRVGVAALRRAVHTLGQVQALELPAELLTGVAPARVARWRARAAGEHPSTLRRDHPRRVRLTLLAVWCWCRQRELTDTVVDLLVALVHRIHSQAGQREAQARALLGQGLAGEDEQVLLRLAKAVLAQPQAVVGTAVFAVVAEPVLRELVERADQAPLRLAAALRQARLRSYTRHYRVVLSALLGGVVQLACRPGSAEQPVVDAVALLRRYADRPARQVHFEVDPDARVPLDGVVGAQWREMVVDAQGRVERAGYEMCVLGAVREAMRRRGIWVVGAARWGDPEGDLPGDFDSDERRQQYYAAIGAPEEAAQFVAEVQTRLQASLSGLEQALSGEADSTGGVGITTRRGAGWVRLPRLAAQPVPTQLDQLKAEVVRRWGMLSLLDILKEADRLTDLTSELTTVATREALPAEELRRRLLLVLFGLGTNIGIGAVAAAGDHQVSPAQLRRIATSYLSADGLRRAIATVITATLHGRDPRWWGQPTSCASDSKQFGSWASNLTTEWHARYGGPGVMAYWHVERRSVGLGAQLKTCSSSEVVAMLAGLAAHHAAHGDSAIHTIATDTHGASLVGFAFTHLLGYQLTPRLKNIGSARLYRSTTADHYPTLEPVCTRAIDWDLITDQYHQMIRYATALRLDPTHAEQILARFIHPSHDDPTHAAVAELGHAVRTAFIAQYLASPNHRRTIHEHLQVVEAWNSANTVIFTGKNAELTGPSRDRQEIALLALHLLQSALVLVNTRLIEHILREPTWATRLTEHDKRGLTPLFWSHLALHGTFELDLHTHLDYHRNPHTNRHGPPTRNPTDKPLT